MQDKKIKNIALLLLSVLPVKVLVHYFIYTNTFSGERYSCTKILRIGEQCPPEHMRATGSYSYDLSLSDHINTIFTNEVWLFIPVILFVLFIGWYFGLFNLKIISNWFFSLQSESEPKLEPQTQKKNQNLKHSKNQSEAEKKLPKSLEKETESEGQPLVIDLITDEEKEAVSEETQEVSEETATEEEVEESTETVSEEEEMVKMMEELNFKGSYDDFIELLRTAELEDKFDENGNLEADVNNGEKVIDNMLLKFQKNIKEVKPEFDAVTSRREIIKSYYLKGLEIDNMIEHFGVIIRSETLDAYRKEELTIDDICSSIEGFYLICEELRKIIETKQKLFNNGEISESSDALIYNYWSSHSLHLGYVQTLTLLRKEDPKFDVMKWGKYFNEHTFYYNPK